MRSRDDNEFSSAHSAGKSSRRARPPAWVAFLGAVLAGNAVYFLLLFPHLPEPWQHQPFAFDRGLALDFFLCLAFYGLVRLARALV